MYKINLIALLISALFLSAPLSAQQVNAEYVQEEVERIASTLPKRIDAATILTSLKLDKKVLQYSYRVNMDEIFRVAGSEIGLNPSEMRQTILERYASIEDFINVWADNVVTDLFTRKNCTTPVIRRILESGYSLLHTSYAPNGDFLFEFRVTRSDCV